MRRRALLLAAAVGIFVPLIPGGPAGAGEDGGRRLSATLNGASEVPGPGDPDGSGSARLWLKPWKEEICFEIEVAAITLPAAAAHIHAGAAGVAGPIVVTLTPPSASGASDGCVDVARSLVRAIKEDPGDYYVNVHTTDFPAGAVRGQLRRGFAPPDEERVLTASLRGSREVPGPGDPNGTGRARITIDPSADRVCWWISVEEITLPATAAHIHRGGTAVAGPIVVTLSPPDATGKASGCVTGVSHDLVKAMLESPSAYYVNVHTTDFPAGAVRGQLTRDHDADDDADDGDDDDEPDDD